MTGKNRLPRLDLHCHLDGSLSQGCIEELLGRSVKLEELQADMDCQSLAEYLEKFEIPLECLQTEKGLERAGYDLMKSAASDQVDYIEARFAPLFSGQRGLSTEQVIESVLRGMEQGKKEFDIDYGVIVCAMRHEKEEANLQMLKAAREFLGNGVCAADLAGNEAAFPMSQFMNLFAEVKRMEMPFTLHAGECGSVQNILDAVQCFQSGPWNCASRAERSDPDLQRQTHWNRDVSAQQYADKSGKGSCGLSHPGVFAGEPSCYDQYG